MFSNKKRRDFIEDVKTPPPGSEEYGVMQTLVRQAIAWKEKSNRGLEKKTLQSLREYIEKYEKGIKE